MSQQNSQIGRSPSEPLVKNNDSQSNIDQLLSIEIRTSSQALIQMNTTNMIQSQIPLIPMALVNNNILRTQHARRGRYQQQQQQLRRQERLRQEELEREQRRQRQNERQQERLRQQELEREQRRQNYNNRLQSQHPSATPTNPMSRQLYREANLDWYNDDLYHQDEIEQINQIDAFEKMNQEEEIQRQQWEQEQINELEGFDILEQLISIQNETEQLQQIATVQTIIDEEQQERNNEELIQLEQSENNEFLLQQLN